MNIAELQVRQGNVEVVGKIIEKAEPREFEKFGKKGKVVNAKFQDASGAITLTLWNEQADEFNVGDTVKVSNGFVNEWQGEKQLTAGKFGKLEKVEGDKSAQEIIDETKPGPDVTAGKPEDKQTESDAGDVGKPEDSVTNDEKVEADVVAGEKKPSDEESKTSDEIIEEEISVEEEDIE